MNFTDECEWVGAWVLAQIVVQPTISYQISYFFFFFRNKKPKINIFVLIIVLVTVEFPVSTVSAMPYGDFGNRVSYSRCSAYSRNQTCTRGLAWNSTSSIFTIRKWINDMSYIRPWRVWGGATCRKCDTVWFARSEGEHACFILELILFHHLIRKAHRIRCVTCREIYMNHLEIFASPSPAPPYQFGADILCWRFRYFVYVI